MSVRPTAVSAALLAAGLLLAGCGSSSGSATAASTPPAASTSTAATAPTSSAPAARSVGSSVRSTGSATGSATGTTTTDGGTAGAFAVCTILPFTEAARLAGQPYTQGEPSDSDGMDGCAYDNADATVPGLNVTILLDEEGDTWAAVHQGDLTDITSLGDKALWDNDNTLYAVKGKYVIQVNGDELNQAAAQALATPVLAALP